MVMVEGVYEGVMVVMVEGIKGRRRVCMGK